MRGYTYTYDGGKLVSAFGKMYGGTLRVLSDPAGNPFIAYEQKP
ncbi:MAG: hypothetical protein ACLSAP_09070 [Oscillospiraceae bacterium]